MIKVNTIKSKFLCGSFEQNTYILTDKETALIIDAGAELDDVKQIVGDKKVLGILMTHLHFDHFWNLDKYLQEFNTEVYIQENFENKFTDNLSNASVLCRLDFEIKISKNKIKYYAKNFCLGKFDIEIFKTPGHSADSVCILIDDKLFTGDTVFSDCIGRIDLKDSNKTDMIQSLELIQKIDFITAFPGHYESASKNQIIKTIGFYI